MSDHPPAAIVRDLRAAVESLRTGERRLREIAETTYGNVPGGEEAILCQLSGSWSREAGSLASAIESAIRGDHRPPRAPRPPFGPGDSPDPDGEAP